MLLPDPAPAFVPAVLVPEPAAEAKAAPRRSRPRQAVQGRMVIEVGRGRPVVVDGTVDAEALARVLDVLERFNAVRRDAEIDKANARNRHWREIAEFWRKQAPKMTVQPRPSQSFLHGMATEGGEMGKALKGIVRPRYYAMPQQPEKPRAPVHSTFKRALSSTSPLQPPSPDPARSLVNSQFRERFEPSKGNIVRHAGITDRFQGEQAIKRWQRGEIDEIDRRMREAVDKLRDEREQDKRDRDDLKAKHERAREDARRELGIPHPKDREREEHDAPEPEPEIETDRYGNEIIDMAGLVAPEQPRDEPPPLEPDSYIPADPPPPEYDFEMGD